MRTPDTYEGTTIRELAALVRHIAEQCPELASRAEKAALILLNAKCAETAEPDVYEVVSACGVGAYRVDQARETCDCADFTHRGVEYKDAKWCKHRLACLFLVKLGRQRPSARLARLSAFRPAERRRPARLIGKVA